MNQYFDLTRFLQLPILASEHGKDVDALIIWVHWLMIALFIGWIIDLFLIPAMDREADMKYQPGQYDYNIAWILLTFLGLFGVHRMYIGKWITGILYFFTGGFFLIGWLYDLWTLNSQVSERNSYTRA